MCLCMIKGNLHSKRAGHDGRTCPAMGQVWQPHGASSAKERSWPNIIHSTFCSWNCKGPRKCKGINITYELSELVLRNTNYNVTKNEPKNVILNCPSFRLAFWADLFFELLLGLPNPLMPNNTKTLIKRTNHFWIKGLLGSNFIKGVRALRGYFGPPMRSKSKNCSSQVSSF